jgi:N utilization substance protein A
MVQTKFMAAINQICDEKGLPKDVVVSTVEAALAAAYKKDYGKRDQQVTVKIDQKTGNASVFVTKEVVDKVEDEATQISFSEARKLKKNIKIGDSVDIEQTPRDYGRIAAQTAKQVIIQRIREAERDIIFNEYKNKESDLLTGVVQRIEGKNVIVDIGKTYGIIYPSEQIPNERYYIGQRIKVYLTSVEQTSKGPQIILSRAHPGFIKRLFELEVPEILSKTVVIKSIAREAGSRSKVAVTSSQEGVDPVGSCVGQRGTRVQAIIAGLGDEKIDIVLWDSEPATYITNALSPAKVSDVKISEKKKQAKVKVPQDQLSLAIGKEGQNVRLAAKLTDWKIDIEGVEEKKEKVATTEVQKEKPAETAKDEEK